MLPGGGSIIMTRTQMLMTMTKTAAMTLMVTIVTTLVMVPIRSCMR